MHIEELALINFRNYSNLKLQFSEGLNILYGNNAQGKTNVLESIFLTSTGRSHRTSKDLELIKFDQDNYLVKLILNTSDNKISLDISYDKNGKRNIKINDKKISKIGNLMGKVLTVMFSPEDLFIVKGSPSDRRRFIDIAISQLKPSYFYDLQIYNKILTQRNALLKDIQKNKSLNKSLYDTLDVWNLNFIKIGSRIMKYRYDFLKDLNNRSAVIHKTLTDNDEFLKIKYNSSVLNNNWNDLELIQEFFCNELKKINNKEIYRGTSLIGPHKDDIEILINDNNIKIFGSQGQQRTVVLSLKLSLIEIIKDDIGESPILLLDDVMSELDFIRQRVLLEKLNNIQAFITCTDKFIINSDKIKNIKYFNINEGKVL